MGRVLGRQEASLIGKNQENCKKTHFLMKKSENYDEIGQIVVSGAVDQTKKIRKTAADIFAKSGPEKP